MTRFDSEHVQYVNNALQHWFRKNRRFLPWRNRRTVYRSWIAEIMLQQTTVPVVGEKFKTFTARFPDVNSLAAAGLDEVMMLWQGLGYYARGRNLHLAARQICRDGWPCSREEWLRLPGVGHYTAAAMAALHHHHPAMALDGNLLRVLSRIYDLRLPRPQLRQALVAAEAGLVDRRHPADWNEALMDLGSAVCRSRLPDCDVCPLNIRPESLSNRLCLARAAGKQHPQTLPLPTPKRKRPEVYRFAVIIRDRQKRIALLKRPAQGLWSNLYSVPVVPGLSASPVTGSEAENALEDYLAALSGPYRRLPGPCLYHGFTHFRLQLQAVQIILSGKTVLPPALFWAESVRAWPLPALISKLLNGI